MNVIPTWLSLFNWDCPKLEMFWAAAIGRRKLQAMTRWARWEKIRVMTFLMKKRINTELFIDKNKGLYIQKGDKETDRQKYLTSKKKVNWNGGKSKAGMKTRAACLEWLTIHGRKDKLMAACLKRLWAWKVKNGVLKQMLR